MSHNAPAALADSRQRNTPRNGPASGPFQALQPLNKFQKANRHVFPSVPSLRWFYQKHRAELIESGAVVELAGRLFVNGRVFEQTAVAIGARTAAARAQR